MEWNISRIVEPNFIKDNLHIILVQYMTVVIRGEWNTNNKDKYRKLVRIHNSADTHNNIQSFGLVRQLLFLTTESRSVT